METSQTYDVCWTSHAVETFAHLARFHLADRYTDVTVIAGPSRFRAHRAVLAAASTFFERAFDQVALDVPDASSVRTAVVLKDLPGDVLRHVFNFMYTGEAHVPPELFNDFMALAENLEIRGLMCHVGEQSADAADGHSQLPLASGYTVSTTEPPGSNAPPRVSDLVTEELLSSLSQKEPGEDVVIREMLDLDGMDESNDGCDEVCFVVFVVVNLDHECESGRFPFSAHFVTIFIPVSVFSFAVYSSDWRFGVRSMQIS